MARDFRQMKDTMRNYGLNRRRIMEIQEKRKRRICGYLALLLCLFALAGLFSYHKGIGPFSKDTTGIERPIVNDSRTKEETRKDFDKLVQEIFKEEVTDDSITLNYTIKNLEKYGIENVEASLGEYSLEELQNSILVSENRVATLETYDYRKLTTEQKLIYDILYHISKHNLKSADFLEYAECLGPTTGIQAQLPVYFAEYNFYQQEDIDTYIKTLKLVPKYFEKILEFEQKKSEDGIFMSDTTAQAIINQCKEFIKTPKDNYLLSTFEKKLSAVKDISEEEKDAYISENKRAVLNSVIPAYEALWKGLEELKGTGKNGGGLCHFEKGKEYYEYLVTSLTGSEWTLEEMDTLLDKKIKQLMKEISDVMANSPDTYYDAQDASYPYAMPEDALKHLQKEIEKDFPELKDGIECQIKKVDSSLEESMSPAFYLTPALDDYKNNVIYINENEKYDLSKAFTTIGHEGYPGHLYQTCYFLSQNPAPIRSVIHVTGYTEGWGTYAELYSYDLAGLKKDTAKLLKKNTLATLCIYAKADLGIHYLGWDYKKLQTYLTTFGFSKTSAKSIYDTMVAEPGAYMPYTIGYLEIEDLKNEAQEKLSDQFDIKEFHEFFLNIGAAPFGIIRDRMQEWIKNEEK